MGGNEESSPLACVHARPKMFGDERLGLWSVREFCGDGILVPQKDSDRPVASPPKPRPSRWWALSIEEEDVGSHVSTGAKPTLGDMACLILRCLPWGLVLE